MKFKINDTVIIDGAIEEYNHIICKVIENKDKFCWYNPYPTLKIMKGNSYHKKGKTLYRFPPDLLVKLRS